MCNVKLTMIPVHDGAFGAISKNLEELEIRGIINHHQVVLTSLTSLTLSVCLSVSLSLSLRPYHPLLRTGLPYNILCPLKPDINNLLLVNQQWHVHVLGSIEKRHLSSSLLLQQCPAGLLRLRWFSK